MAMISPAHLTLHQDSGLVPPMKPQEYAELVADIRQRGVLVPIDVIDSVVLDGRHRLRAARELGFTEIPVHAVTLNGEAERDWMLKAAVLRRHLTDDQRAMMAAMYAKAHPERAGRPKGNTPHTGRSNFEVRKPLHHVERTPARHRAANRLRVAPTRAERAAKVLKANPELAARVHSGEKKLAQAVREVRHTEAKERVEVMPQPDGVFDAITLDPPWRYDRQPGDSGMRGEVDYATMSFDELARLVLPAAPNCVLFLWVTNSFMRHGYDLLDIWKFEPKTILTWDKVHIGLGSWLRNVTEHCIVAVRGQPLITLTNQSTLIREARREHSRKPEAFYALGRKSGSRPEAGDVQPLCAGPMDHIGHRSSGIDVMKTHPQAPAATNTPSASSRPTRTEWPMRMHARGGPSPLLHR